MKRGARRRAFLQHWMLGGKSGSLRCVYGNSRPPYHERVLPETQGKPHATTICSKKKKNGKTAEEKEKGDRFSAVVENKKYKKVDVGTNKKIQFSESKNVEANDTWYCVRKNTSVKSHGSLDRSLIIARDTVLMRGKVAKNKKENKNGLLRYFS
ncbi:hypothetical protein HZH66_010176 [Vespula vulgaris]|uniref:Uncharacterized protein n=1 Tax=Vespula vulgaris TaxID=7454 RepID=A0A834JLB1_VESVU|nr:hypothetical protein HZH66_010176 [Vespula vulgaris]